MLVFSRLNFIILCTSRIIIGLPVEVPPEHPEQNSYKDESGNAWFQALMPNFETNRGKPPDGRFGVHPDGGKDGTGGCIGITSSNTQDLFDFLTNNPVLDLQVVNSPGPVWK